MRHVYPQKQSAFLRSSAAFVPFRRLWRYFNPVLHISLFIIQIRQQRSPNIIACTIFFTLSTWWSLPPNFVMLLYTIFRNLSMRHDHWFYKLFCLRIFHLLFNSNASQLNISDSCFWTFISKCAMAALRSRSNSMSCDQFTSSTTVATCPVLKFALIGCGPYLPNVCRCPNYLWTFGSSVRLRAEIRTLLWIDAILSLGIRMTTSFCS